MFYIQSTSIDLLVYNVFLLFGVVIHFILFGANYNVERHIIVWMEGDMLEQLMGCERK